MATNLFGRGMDIERVNIVFNYDMPEDSDTYLHRVARAGRFGTKVSAGTLSVLWYESVENNIRCSQFICVFSPFSLVSQVGGYMKILYIYMNINIFFRVWQLHL